MPYGLPPEKDTPENNAKLERCVADLKAQGHDESSAVAICKSTIQGENMPDNMTAEGPRALGLIALDADAISAESRSRIEVFPGVGKYDHHQGKFEITQKSLDEWLADINERGDKISLDFDHSFVKGGGSAAAGWFVPGTAALEDGKLMADIELTPDGEQAVKTKKYRFISPEFALKYKDMHGKIHSQARLEAATLTNRPFFENMAPVTICDKSLAELIADRDKETTRLLDAADVELLRRVADKATRELMTASLQSIDAKTRDQTRTYLMSLNEVPEEPDVKELTETLGLAADASPEQILAAVKALREEEKRVEAEKAAIAERLKTKSRKPNAKEHDMDLSLIAAELGLSEDSDDATVIAALREARSAISRSELDGEELERLRADSKAKGKLEERVKVIEAERRNDKVKRMLEDGVRAGKVIPAEKTALAKLFAMNPDGLFELLAARPEHVFRTTAIGSDRQPDLDESLYGVAEEFESKEADGGIDPESAKLHLRAKHILAEQGKRNPTEEEYFAALSIASESAVA